jgi:hypothetical protein
MTGGRYSPAVEGLGAGQVGVVNSAIRVYVSVCAISAVFHFTRRIVVVTDTVGDMGHNPVECEWIGPIGFGIGDGMAESVVVLEGFHRFRLRGLRDGLK